MALMLGLGLGKKMDLQTVLNLVVWLGNLMVEPLVVWMAGRMVLLMDGLMAARKESHWVVKMVVK